MDFQLCSVPGNWRTRIFKPVWIVGWLFHVPFCFVICRLFEDHKLMQCEHMMRRITEAHDILVLRYCIVHFRPGKCFVHFLKAVSPPSFTSCKRKATASAAVISRPKTWLMLCRRAGESGWPDCVRRKIEALASVGVYVLIIIQEPLTLACSGQVLLRRYM